MTDGTSAALFAAAAGESLHRWYDSQKFCGRCGARMEKSAVERAMVCPQCKNTVYPKICPAVIAAVHDGDRLLLTRYRGRPFKKYALIAGFNEIGESIEDTVHREVMEEAGLRVKNLRFYRSSAVGVHRYAPHGASSANLTAATKLPCRKPNWPKPHGICAANCPRIIPTSA